MCKIIEIIYGYKVLISSILCHIFWQKEWLVHLCTYDNVRIAVYIVYDFYEKMCNCVRTKLQFRHSNDNYSTRTWTRVWLSLQWSYIHLPTKMLFIISFCKSLLVNSNIYTYKVHRYLNIYRLSVIYQFEKKTGDGYTYTLSQPCIHVLVCIILAKIENTH